MSSIFQWLIYFLLRSEASNKAKPTITSWDKEIRTAYGNSLLPAIFYYEAKRVTKQSRLTPHRSQRYVSLTQAANYRLFFIKYSTEAYLSWRKDGGESQLGSICGQGVIFIEARQGSDPLLI